jgi:hypothetical protein
VATVRPEWMKPRADGKTPDRWQIVDAPPISTSTRVDIERGRIDATTLDSPLGDTLRTLALVRARYGFVPGEIDDVRERMSARRRRSHYAPTAIEIAKGWHEQRMADAALRARGLEPEHDVDIAKVYASRIEHMKPEQAAALALEHLHTDASRPLLRAIGSTWPGLRDTLRKMKRATRDSIAYAPSSSRRDREDDEHWRVARMAQDVIDVLENAAAGIGNVKPGELDHEAQPGEQREDSENGHAQPGNGNLWQPLRLGSTSLVVAHRGRIGARHRPSATGSRLRSMSRALTDPERRVFSTRQRATDALLVLDLSGSMSWDTDELDAVIEAARGAVVVGYSGNPRDPKAANVWLLAQHGRRVREMPEVCGDNGVDGPALDYAVRRYRKRAGMPVVWVSDGAVTGLSSHTTQRLAADMVGRLERHRVTQVVDADAAIDLCQRLARGHRARPHIDNDLREYARTAN